MINSNSERIVQRSAHPAHERCCDIGTALSGVPRICCEEGQRWKLCHGALTADFRAGYSSCSMTNSSVTDRKSCELMTSANLAGYTILG